MSDDFFSNLIRRIFPERNEQTDKLPLVTQQLTRPIPFRHAYAAWLGSERFVEMIRNLQEQYQRSIEKGLANEALQRYESPQSNGFYFNAMMGFSADEFRFLLDHFADITASLGYRRQLAERRYSEKPGGVHCLERYYLKPELTAFQPPIDQLYGNVHLELVLLNDEPSFLKVMAHVYQDRNYKEPLPFASFAERLLQTELLN